MSFLKFVGVFFNALAIGRGRYHAKVARGLRFRAEGQLGTAGRTVRAAAGGRLMSRTIRRAGVRSIKRFIR